MKILIFQNLIFLIFDFLKEFKASSEFLLLAASLSQSSALTARDGGKKVAMKKVIFELLLLLCNVFSTCMGPLSFRTLYLFITRLLRLTRHKTDRDTALQHWLILIRSVLVSVSRGGTGPQWMQIPPSFALEQYKWNTVSIYFHLYILKDS